MDNWEIEFRKQVAKDGHTIEMLDKENMQMRARIAELEHQVEKIEKQEMHGMNCTLDQMLSEDQRETWGLDKQEHWRNIQLMFCRALGAISELEHQVESMRNCENCKNYGGGIGVCDVEYCELGSDREDDCFDNNRKHWQPRDASDGTKEGGE